MDINIIPTRNQDTQDDCWPPSSFVDSDQSLEDLKCAICLGVVREAMMCPSCQSPFGKECLLGVLGSQSDGVAQCPCCRTPLRVDDVVPARTARGLVMKLRVHCPSEGCEEKPVLQNLQEHYETCPLRTVHCASSGCQYKCAQREMSEHLALCEAVLVDCPLRCPEKVPRRDVSAHVQSSCPLRPVSCPQKCGWDGPATEIDAHLSTCSSNSVSSTQVEEDPDPGCPITGCADDVEGEELYTHLQRTPAEHFMLLAAEMERLKARVERLQGQLSETRADLLLTQKELRAVKRPQPPEKGMVTAWPSSQAAMFLALFLLAGLISCLSGSFLVPKALYSFLNHVDDDDGP
eukprot:Rmarinus@m.14457